jgi:hypothetical protein
LVPVFVYESAIASYAGREGACSDVQALAIHRPPGAQGKQGGRDRPPITITKKDDDGEVEDSFTRFKLVKCLFAYSQTEGADIPMPEVPEWSLDRALSRLDIRRVTYRFLDANATGYSYDRNMAISPVDEHPLMTAAHEAGHILLGHTTETSRAEYQQHRGLMEFGAESVAYLSMHELGTITDEETSESRGYIQNWLQTERPGDATIRQVFRATDQLLRAGRPAEEGV